MKKKLFDYDVIVVGGGHAGIEAAYAASKMGSRVLLLTLDIEKIGTMPCNPAIGGVGKGHMVFEVSALGGLMPKLCTTTYLQARMLNTKKGPAVQGLRLQIDKHAYNKAAVATLKKTKNLTLAHGMAQKLLVNDAKQVIGVETANGTQHSAPCVILTTGTFLNGLCHIGDQKIIAGRRDEQSVPHLSASLQSHGLKMGRLKTGTPPRLLRSSIDFSKLEKQEADNLDSLFEFYPHKVINKQDCYITYTNANTHKIIQDNLHLSAMYSGTIKGIGPRYCPSIEDKIARFPQKDSHHVFVEPESDECDDIYPNGISTSLPLSVQEQYIRSIAGFEQAIITKPGYAVEYDFVFPDQLTHALETKAVAGLFLAGQINGTTGYEEAAGQGIIAGINAHLKAHDKEPYIFDRNLGYIGVMIDDLVTLGVDEPYRMFTSRAERRLVLRQDNVFFRLSDDAFKLGLIDQELYDAIQAEKKLVEDTVAQLRKHKDFTRLLGNQEAHKEKVKALTNNTLTDRQLETIWAELRYGPYIDREQREIEKTEQYRELKIPAQLDVSSIQGLSKELQQKLSKHKPETIAQAMLISGMTPAAISLLIFKSREFYKQV